ncbi:hypothetical protein Leryth_013884 [Lithospermum erythrorhizon]|nr:hypothetical protein Leryth_013884 [Lithospermum erythrorhizon]
MNIYIQVWSSVKCNVDDPEKPSHEIDILAGHENVVNYVQFRSSTSDSIMEDNILKFNNSWHRHDNIVTCSRDGSHYLDS